MAQPRSHRARVLVLDGDAAAAERLVAALPEAAASCAVADTADAGLEALAREPFDVVVLAAELDGDVRRRLVEAAHLVRPGVQFILVGDEATDEPSLFERLAPPLDAHALEASVRRAAAEHERFLAGPSASEADAIVLGSSPSFLAALDAVDRVAHSSAPVLLVGETGTGKDILAHRIHMRGQRRNRPFVVVNAAAIPSSLLDSELFGHVGGAFTGATRPRRGLVHEADGGTLFLDEIADLPIELQGRLLRVVETGFVRAVGADQERHVDVRFLAATHRELSAAVAAGAFREDLYFRLNVLSISVPPLRERGEDVRTLARWFFERARARNARSPAVAMSAEAEDLLATAHWPGNVRELASVIERIVVLAKQAEIGVGDVAGLVTDGGAAALPRWSADDMCSLRTMTSRYVEWVLAQTGGDKARAAAVLEVDVSTLYRWQRRHSG